MNYKKNIAMDLLSRLFIISVGFFVSVIITRALGPTGKGNVAFLLLIAGILANYGHFGLNNASTFFYTKENVKRQEIFNSNITFLTIVAIIITIILSVLKIKFGYFTDYNYYMIFLACLFVYFSFYSQSIITFYVAKQEIIPVSRGSFLARIVMFSILLCLMFFRKISSISYLFLVTLEPFLLSLFLSRGFRYRVTVNVRLIISQLRFGFIVYLSNFLVFLNYRVDQFYIRYYEGKYFLGIYSVVVTLAELAFVIPTSISQSFTGKLLNSNKFEQKQIATKTIKYTFYLTLIVSCIGILMTPLIPVIYGKDFYLGIMSAIVLFIGIPFAAVGKVTHSYYYSQGRPHVHTIISAIVLVINILLNMVLIPWLGILGASLASTVAYICYGIIYFWILIQREYFSMKDLVVLSKQEIREIYTIVYNKIRRMNNE